MRTNFSWLIGSATVTLCSRRLGRGNAVAARPRSQRHGVGRPPGRAGLAAGRLPRPGPSAARTEPFPGAAAVAQRLRAARAPVRVQLPHVRSALAPVDVTPSTETPHVAIRPHVVLTAPVPVPVPARPSVPALPTTVAPPAPAVPTPPATPAPQPTTPEPIPAAPAAPHAQLATVATVPTGLKKTTGKADKSAVPSRRAGVAALPDTRAGRADAPGRRPRRRRQLEAEARLLRAGEGQSPRQAQGRLMSAHGH